MKNRCRVVDKIRVDKFRDAKKQHLNDMGKRLVENQSSSKAYFKILHELINKANIPRIPTIIYENIFVVNCKEKACLFNEFFLHKPIAKVFSLSTSIMKQIIN